MMPESVSPVEMKDILKEEHGVVFFPKRQLERPEVNENGLIDLFRSEKSESVMDSVRILVNFLDAEPVGDKFGKDHEKRREWRNEMHKKYGDVFGKVYGRNQFRINQLGLVRFSIAILEKLSRESGASDLSRSLSEIFNEVDMRLQGQDPKSGKKISPSYEELESLEEKLGVVHFFEDRILEVLELFS